MELNFDHMDENHPHHRKMNKMHRQDTLILIFWIGALWICLAFVYFTVMQVDHDYAKLITLIIGIILGVFATAALLACNIHLTTNKRQLYLTDIMHQREGPGFIKLFDIFFILILCYISLLLPILLRGTVLVGSGPASGMHYTLNPPLLIAVVVTTFGYLFFMLRKSDKEMREVYNLVYGPRDKNQSHNSSEELREVVYGSAKNAMGND